ncbi:hypothetical protein TREMEDRAFT_70956 [Tremella mesenterica DSM 1558]|uniref:uncharacterized protein n=1 Tax=Tremella mesenterica (strain ATCC 24925 / CBS 8224 / DSM 1558 / NBRC 9311 / NRRL Y-6157 / RJB 2259-6 / UBC 559-6) TaxID=578456 RepID=UPI0003F498E5|nr:uncharacterized protein TREMEDRAFT_70956 [Tremella mesenterica DSM 1558]EIW73371.1 hypothetical protein TREMEDRAFT_70956 [Tremella mesenterica DSM 1558]
MVFSVHLLLLNLHKDGVVLTNAVLDRVYLLLHYPYPDPTYLPLGVTPSPPPPPHQFIPPNSVPNLAAFTHMPTYGSQSVPAMRDWRSFPANMPIPEDDTIPTAIVIKNIPFAVTKETLEQVIKSLGAPLPYAFNYHLDNGVFRGLAFANFRAYEEAAAVVAALNGYDVHGRKLRVEYKKVLQPGEKDKIEREKALKRMRSIHFEKELPPPISVSRANGFSNGLLSTDSPPQSASSATSDSLPVTLDFNDPITLDIHTRIAVFKEDRMRDELAFSRNLSPTERRIVHLVAQKLGVTTITKADGDIKYVVVTREQPRPSFTTSTSATVSTAYLSPYGAIPDQLSPSLRMKKSMPDLRGFNGPVVARDPARSLTPQRSSGNLRDGSREYVSMGAAHGRRANGTSGGSGSFNSLFGNSLDIPPVPPLPSGLGLQRNSMPSMHGAMYASSVSTNGTGESEVTNAPLRNPRGPAGDARGFQTLRPSASGILRGGLSGRVSEEEEEIERARTRESLDI